MQVKRVGTYAMGQGGLFQGLAFIQNWNACQSDEAKFESNLQFKFHTRATMQRVFVVHVHDVQIRER